MRIKVRCEHGLKIMFFFVYDCRLYSDLEDLAHATSNLRTGLLIFITRKLELSSFVVMSFFEPVHSHLPSRDISSCIVTHDCGVQELLQLTT